MTYSDELFRNFVAALTEEPDTIKISGKALGILSRLVPFDKVSLLLQIPPSAVLSDGDTLMPSRKQSHGLIITPIPPVSSFFIQWKGWQDSPILRKMKNRCSIPLLRF